ncbi:hypothetical protein [Vibrio sp. WXL210]|uniref:hypothetical protein n=1 Tax=Vibrio sp. WXL210 TaxID=3450709 RepID=UPI003EC766CC
MKQKALSIAIANVLLVSTSAIAADDYDFAQISPFSGNLGLGYEYEEKQTTYYQGLAAGMTENERIHTTYLGKFMLRHERWDASISYDLKHQSIVKDREFADGSKIKDYETMDGFYHVLTLNKSHYFGNNITGGLLYILEAGKVDVEKRTENAKVGQTSIDQSLSPTLSYFDPFHGVGVYAQADLIHFTIDNSVKSWGKIEEQGYGFIVKPYYKTGNWELGLEFFYQNKDTEFSVPGFSNKGKFEEVYVNPSVLYSFDRAGTLVADFRIGKNETKDMFHQYETDILKGSLGYEQNIGNDWTVKAEYEWTKDVEDRDGQRDKKAVGNKVYAHALYRF